jgi:hypothetical protein
MPLRNFTVFSSIMVLCFLQSSAINLISLLLRGHVELVGILGSDKLDIADKP